MDMPIMFALLGLVPLLSLFGLVMLLIGNHRLRSSWDRIDQQCDRKDEMYHAFIRAGWTPPENSAWRRQAVFVTPAAMAA